MQQYLIDEARDQIWCNPRQDRQYILQPDRVTYGAGAISQVFALSRYIDLPFQDSYSQVFQVGQFPPFLLGLFEQNPSWLKEKWFSIADAMNTSPLYVNIYTNRGVNIPRENVYFMYTREKCLLFCIKSDKIIDVKYTTDIFYFRFYSNAYLRTLNQATPVLPFIQVSTFKPLGIQGILEVRAAWLDLNKKAGHTEIWVNGYLVDAVDLLNIQPGDTVELIYDLSVKRMVTWKSNELVPFTSTLDHKLKYLLHYSRDIEVEQIDFQDDIDVYVKYNKAPGVKVGYYYPKNLPDAMRMVTHRDYSLTGDYVDYIARCIVQDLGIEGYDFSDFEITLKIRQGGYNRPLIFDANRIHELYKLTDDKIMMSMSGVNTLVPVWNAAHLEASAYTLIMREELQQITIDQVEQAYGYNSISTNLAATPSRTTMSLGQPYAKLPYELALGPSTVYEFDYQGYLLGVYKHLSKDDDYNATNRECSLIEALVGEGTQRPNDVYGRNNIPLQSDATFRVYRTHLNFDYNPPKPMVDRWTDITESEGLYEVSGNVLKWVSDETDQYLMVRFDNSFLSYSFTTKQNEGVLLFSIQQIDGFDGVINNRNMMIPRGDLQIWLNGKNLVRDIDYVLRFPYICVNNQSYFNQPAKTADQTVHVRFTGFCTEDLKLQPIKSTGFVVNGALSNDKHYTLHDDKVMHISVAGGVYAKDEVTFFEDNPQWDPRSPYNGTPYQINDIIVPLKDFTQESTYSLLDKALVIDELVESYMSQYYPPAKDEPISVASARWRLTSPFISKLVDLCVNDSISFVDADEVTDQKVLEICKPYEALLAYDPINEENKLPDRYINVTPTRYNAPVAVDVAQYGFLQSVCRLYSNNQVGLNNFITISAPIQINN